MSEVGVKETEGLSMVKVTSEQAQGWGSELRRVVDIRDRIIGRNPYAGMEKISDKGAQELWRGYELGRGSEDYDLKMRAENIVLKPETDPGREGSVLGGAWMGEVEVPVLGIFGLGVRLGEIHRVEKSLPFPNTPIYPSFMSTTSGLMGEYRKQLQEKNPELLQVLDAILVGIKKKKGKNG